MNKLIGKLYRNNECLVVEVNNHIYVADSYSKEVLALKEYRFSGITFDGYELSETREMSEVMFFELNSENMRNLTNGMYETYSKLLIYAQDAYKKSRGKKGILNIGAIAQESENFDETFQELMSTHFKNFFESAGDSIIALDGKPVSYTDFLAAMAERRQNAKALQNDSINPHQISLTYVRDGKTDVLTLTTDSAFKIGVAVNPYTDQLLPVIRKEYGFFESFPAGVALGVKTLKGYVGNMKYLFSKEGAKQLGGFGTIGSIFPATWNWHQFWYMTAFLSIILAFMNILPIPALDGGHVLFLFYEIIARRKPSDKFMEYAQMAGMILLFGLLIWANFNDILRFFF